MDRHPQRSGVTTKLLGILLVTEHDIFRGIALPRVRESLVMNPTFFDSRIESNVVRIVNPISV